MQPKTGFASVPLSCRLLPSQKGENLAPQKRQNCERINAPIFTIRVLDLGAILIPLRLFARNFIFGTEANISARDEVRHIIRQQNLSPVCRVEISAQAEIRHLIRPLVALKFYIISLFSKWLYKN